MDTQDTHFFPKSFNYFKLGMLFYFLCYIKNIKKDDCLKLFNQIQEFNQDSTIFDKIYKNIFENKNALVFTYFQQLPNIFLPLPSDIIYYKPYITFYTKNPIPSIDEPFKINDLMKNFYTDRIKIHEYKKNKWLDKYIQDQHIFPDPITTYIPINDEMINIINNTDTPDTVYILYYENNSYIAKKNGNVFNLIYKKENLYIKINKDIELDINKLDYLMIMKPITKMDILNCFDMDVLPKKSLLYHTQSEDLTEGILRQFYGLYPNNNMINPFGLFNDADYHCFKYKLIDDLNVLNINRDVFYSDLFDEKDNEDEFIYKDTRDNSKIIKSKLFHCIGDNLGNRKQCNFNIIKDYKSVKTFNRNKGKRMLTLLVSKTTLYWLVNENYYYADFLNHYGIEAFIYHYGIFNGKFLSVELGFCIDREARKKYVEYISMSKGEC
jgi:hypothetical protein